MLAQTIGWRKRKYIITSTKILTPESKDLVNSSTGGDFSKLRVSVAKSTIDRLVNAKKAYDNPRTTMLQRGAVNSVVEQGEDRMEARMDKLEKAILAALEKNNKPDPPEQVKTAPVPEEVYQYYNPKAEAEYQAQVNVVGHWNQNGSWNPGKQMDAPWRDHPNLRWADTNQNPPPQLPTNYQPQQEVQSTWPSRN